MPATQVKSPSTKGPMQGAAGGWVAVVMVLLIIVPLALFNKYQAEAQEQAR